MFVPLSILSTESLIRLLISLAADADLCAKLRTASATTAKPLPCSPARAASTAAFNAKRFVWKAISSITEMISSIFFDDEEISCIDSTKF
ncbi:hypothetical protein D3C72_1687750 [compost metagenome]